MLLKVRWEKKEREKEKERDSFLTINRVIPNLGIERTAASTLQAFHRDGAVIHMAAGSVGNWTLARRKWRRPPPRTSSF